MLQKYGWNETKGLGKDEKGDSDWLSRYYFFSIPGIVAPIQLQSAESLGGFERENNDDVDNTVGDATRERRKLDVELEQTSEMLLKKSLNAERELLIETELKQINREFYCEWCDKQYKSVSEVVLLQLLFWFL